MLKLSRQVQFCTLASAATSPLYLPKQIEHVVPGKNIEEYPDKRLMSNQQRNIVQSMIQMIQYLKEF